jgi:putative ABC transport system permease protein
MSEVSRWRRLFRLPTADVRADVDAELEFHLSMYTRDLIASGLTPSEARARAEQEFGELPPIRNACITIDRRRYRRSTLIEVVEDMLQDMRFGVRSLRKNAGFAVAAILCISLGIGVTATIFSAVDATLLRPLPFARPDELVAVYSANPGRSIKGANISSADYLSWRDEARSWQQIGMWTWSSYALTGSDAEAERVDGSDITANMFPMLGVSPLLGRSFRADEQEEPRNRVVLLSYDLWQRRYAGDSSVVGRTILIDNDPYTVVGVMPANFAFPVSGQLWRPLSLRVGREPRSNRVYAGAIGRLRAGLSIVQARKEMDGLSARLAERFPDESFGWKADLVTLKDDLVGDLKKPLQIFSGAVLFLLLIVCANVANLMLARGAVRQREMAIRTALGGGRGRLVRQLLTESVVLAGAGGLLGVLFALYGVRLLRASFPNGVPYYLPIGVSGKTVAFVAVLSALTGMLFGILPAFRATQGSIEAALREGSRGGTTSLARTRLRSGFVILELALSVMLMIGAGLLIKSYRTIEATKLGFDERGLVSMRISLPRTKYLERSKRAIFFNALLERVNGLPAVASIGSGQGIPFSGWDAQAPFTIEGAPAPRNGEAFISHFQAVSPGFMRTLGVPILRGRGLLESDRDTINVVVVINETFAKRAFPNQDPLGRRVKFGGSGSSEPWATIVGIARDYRHYRLPQPMGPAIYYPYTSAASSSQTLVVKAKNGNPGDLVPTIRKAVRDLDPDVPVYQVRTLQDVVSQSLWRQRLQGQVFGIFAALALLLAAVGVYGVISYSVAQRTREFGVRVALGARARDVLSLVVSQGARLAAIGVSIGMLGALALTRLLTTLLYEVRATDPAVFGGVALILGAIAILACYVPARRATRIDPLVAMRPE